MGKDPVAHKLEHLFRRDEVFEMGPPTFLILVREDATKGFVCAPGRFLIAGFPDVQKAEEHVEGYLFDDHEQVSDPADPEVGLKFIDMVAQFPVDHFRV